MKHYICSIAPVQESENPEQANTYFAKAKKSNHNLFDGNQLVVIKKNLTDGSKSFLELIPVTYSTVLFANKNKKQLIIPAGVAVAVITSDGKIVIGSRGDTKTNTNYGLQVPNGGLDSNPKQMSVLKNLKTQYENWKNKEIKHFETKHKRYASLNYNDKFSHLEKPNTSFEDFIETEGLRELKEELYDFKDDEYRVLNTSLPLWEKYNEKEYLKAGVVFVKTKYSFDELAELRSKYPPKDLWEMEKIEPLPLKEITNVLNDNCKIYFDGKDRLFPDKSGLTMLYDAINNVHLENGISSRLSHEIFMPEQPSEKTTPKNFLEEKEEIDCNANQSQFF